MARVNRPGITKMNPGRKALAGQEIWPVDGDVDEISVPTDYGNIGMADKDKKSVSLPVDPRKYCTPPRSGDDTPGGGW